MKTLDKAKKRPEIGNNEQRLFEDEHFKDKHQTMAGTSICKTCSAIGMHKHWFVDKKLLDQALIDPLSNYVICPGCKRIEDHVFEGEVVLRSPLLAQHREMVYGTIYHTAAKAFHENPLSRLATIEESEEQIRILTTTRTLAERIGKAINGALKGHLQIKPSPREKFVSVHWVRNN